MMRCQTIFASITALVFIPTYVSARAPIQFPALQGPHPVGVLAYSLTDHSRKEKFTLTQAKPRQIDLRIWYPSQSNVITSPPPYLKDIPDEELIKVGAPREIIPALRTIKTRAVMGDSIKPMGPYPVLFVSPGYGNSPRALLSLTEELASQGYVVIGMTHRDPEGKITRKSLKASLKERIADTKFVLDHLENSMEDDLSKSLARHLDFESIGILGHSVGGTTSAEMLLVDARFKAGISLDGSISRKAASKGFDRPFMLLNSESTSVFDPTQKQLYRNLRGDAFSVSLKGAAHDSFTDIPLIAAFFPSYDFSKILSPVNAVPSDLSPTRISAPVALNLMQSYMQAFFNKYLKTEVSPFLEEEPTNPAVIYRCRVAQDASKVIQDRK